MGLTNVERDRVAALRLMVIDGAVVPGVPTRYADLAARLGTDARGIADAVRELARDGFIDLLPDDSFRVAWGTCEDDDVLAIRLLVEPALFCRAAASCRAADLLTLREVADALGAACVKGDFERYLEAREDFYATLVGTLPNQLAGEMVLDLVHRTRLDGARQVLEAGVWADVGPEFRRLVDLLEARDLEGIGDWVRQRLVRLRYLGAPRRGRDEAEPVSEPYPDDMVPFEVDEYADTGW